MTFDRLLQIFGLSSRVVRFIAAGGTAAAVHLGVLYLLTEKLLVWYLFSTTVAFICAFFTSFILQKFWVFERREYTLVHRQFFWYGCIALWNGTLNTGLMYLFVSVEGLFYLLSQVIVSLIIAGQSFYLYRFLFSYDLHSHSRLQ